MDVFFTYDWISVTLPSDKGATVLGQKMFGALLREVDDRVRHGYNRSARWESGACLMWHDARPDMGCHLVLSGTTLSWMFQHGMNAQEVLNWVTGHGGRLSRVDLSVDVTDSGLVLENFAETALKPYKGKGRTPKVTPVGTQKNGWTVYVGSRSSDKFLRIYDKAKEQGLEGVDRIRIELECKGKVAHWLTGELSQVTKEGAYALASSMIRTIADFKAANWGRALSSEVVEFSIPKRTETDTLRWLVSVCAPSLARVVSERPSEPILDIFVEALRQELFQRGIDME